MIQISVSWKSRFKGSVILIHILIFQIRMSLLTALKSSLNRLESAVHMWNRDLLSDISVLRLEGCATDLQLVAMGQDGPSAPLLAHSLVLVAASPVLATLLSSGYLTQGATIIFSGVERQQLEVALEDIYQGNSSAFEFLSYGLVEDSIGEAPKEEFHIEDFKDPQEIYSIEKWDAEHFKDPDKIEDLEEYFLKQSKVSLIKLSQLQNSTTNKYETKTDNTEENDFIEYMDLIEYDNGLKVMNQQEVQENELGESEKGDDDHMDEESAPKKVKILQCHLCPKIFQGTETTIPRSSNMKRHLHDMHTAGTFTCTRTFFCHQILNTRYEKERHVARCFLSCPRENCDSKFDRKDKSEAHKRMHIKEDMRLI